MNTKLFLALLAAGLAGGVTFAQTDTNLSLTGIEAVDLEIADIDLDARLHGLTESDVRKVATNVLKTAGIVIAEPDKGAPVLEVRVSTFWDQRAVLYAFSVRAQLKRAVKIPGTGESVEAATWQSGEPTGLVGLNRLYLVNGAVEKVLTEFVVAYLKANQKD